MKIEIDQSGKIENTNKDTVIAFSNSISSSILIKAKNKREIQNAFRQAGKRMVFVYRLFAILIFILIKKHIPKIQQIIIDTEYPGKSSIIKNFLLQEIRKIAPSFRKDNIMFMQIGKKSRAHYLAYGVESNKKQPDMVVDTKDILKFIAR